MTVETVEVEKKAYVPPSNEFYQFLNDYWAELQRYDPIFGLLTAWGLLTPPSDFIVKKRYRTVIFMTQFFQTIGLTVQLACTRDPTPRPVVIILSLILCTIPVEILNLLWFRIVQTSKEVKEKSATAGTCGKCLLWGIQYLAKTVGSLLGFIVLSYSFVFFVLAFAGIHPGCSEKHRYGLMYHVVLLQFLLMPVLMSLPYWRDQSSLLSCIGQAGPIIGYAMHIRKYGLHPPPPPKPDTEAVAAVAAVTAVAADVTNPVVEQA